MEERMKEAAQEGDIDMLYALIQEDPYVLNRIDETPFIDTPLHVAASSGQTRFAMEILRLKPSFASKSNLSGFTPIHLALQHGRSETAIWFVDVDPGLVRVKGREGVTPLHYVAEKGNTDLLVEFLHACPGSMEDFTVRGETALHLAVKNDMFEAFQLMVGWLRRNTRSPCWESRVLNLRDVEGNTVLHIAALRNQPQVVRLLTNPSSSWSPSSWSIFRDSVHVNYKNLQGLTPLDILEQHGQQINNTEELREVLRRSGAQSASTLPHRTTTTAHHLKSNLSLAENFGTYIGRLQSAMSPDTRDALLVIAALIATSSYQSALSPPGGVWQDDYIPPPINNNGTNNATVLECRGPHVAGTAVLWGEENWDVFTACSLLSFCFSTVVIFFLLPRSPLSDLLVVSLACLFFCFCFASSFVTVPYGYNGSTLTMFVIGVLEFVALHIWFHTRAVQGKLVRRFLKYLTRLHRGTAASSPLPGP